MGSKWWIYSPIVDSLSSLETREKRIITPAHFERGTIVIQLYRSHKKLRLRKMRNESGNLRNYDIQITISIAEHRYPVYRKISNPNRNITLPYVYVRNNRLSSIKLERSLYFLIIWKAWSNERSIWITLYRFIGRYFYWTQRKCGFENRVFYSCCFSRIVAGGL